jgi:5-methylcytosine-specific restriction endonuclease McrA
MTAIARRQLIHKPVLVLNQNYAPLNVCTIRRALVLVLRQKAEVLSDYGSFVISAAHEFAAPSVIRLFSLIRRPRPRVKLSRKEIFVRDNYACQYCGTAAKDLTVDHVIPRSKGGMHSWDNVVTACRHCNHRKGGRTLQEARMRLLTVPREPRAGVYYAIERRLSADFHEHWLPFLPGLEHSLLIESLGISSD